MSLAPRPPAKLHIFVAEDSDPDYVLLQRTLERAGIANIARARNGAEFLEYLIQRLDKPDRLPDVLLVDLNLPGVSGLELMRWVQKRPQLAGIPMYLVTGDLSPETSSLSRQAGASGCFPKPFSLAHVAAILEEATNPKTHAVR